MASAGPIESADDQAAHWAVLAAYGEMTSENRAELEAWLAADSRHYGAYMRARAGLYAIEEAVVEADPMPALDNDNLFRSADARRGLFRRIRPAAAVGAALAASVTAFILVGVPMLVPSKPADIAAMKVLNLKDGSVATLQQGARIAFALDDGTRKVRLLSGQASFKVAKDKRPFLVQSGEVYAQATGTVYSVGRVGFTGGTIRVTEGSVLVWARDGRDQAVLLEAGGTLTLDPGPEQPAAKAKASPPLPPPELAQISLDNVPMKLAIERFNRVNSTKIIIADPAIGDTRIVGLFNANDPEQFASFAAAISSAQVERMPGKLVIKLK